FFALVADGCGVAAFGGLRAGVARSAAFAGWRGAAGAGRARRGGLIGLRVFRFIGVGRRGLIALLVGLRVFIVHLGLVGSLGCVGEWGAALIRRTLGRLIASATASSSKVRSLGFCSAATAFNWRAMRVISLRGRAEKTITGGRCLSEWIV